MFLLLSSSNTMLVGKFLYFFFGQGYDVDDYVDYYYVDYDFSVKITSVLSTGVQFVMYPLTLGA